MKCSLACLISMTLAVSLSNLNTNAQPIDDTSANSPENSAGGDGSSQGQELAQKQEADGALNTRLINDGTLEAQNPAVSGGSATGTMGNPEAGNDDSGSRSDDSGNGEEASLDTSNNNDGVRTETTGNAGEGSENDDNTPNNANSNTKIQSHDSQSENGVGTDTDNLESQLSSDPIAITGCGHLQEELKTNCSGADLTVCERVVHSEDVCGTRIRCNLSDNSQACQVICVALNMVVDLEGMTSEDMFTSIRVAVRTDSGVLPKKMRQVNLRKVVKVFSHFDFSGNTDNVNKIVVFARSTKSCSVV